MNSFFQVSSPRELLNKLPLYQIAQRCLVETSMLGIPDLLASNSLSIDELAAKTKVNAEALYRVMRVLASVGFYEEVGTKEFKNSEVTQLLMSSAPQSMKNSTDILMGGEHFDALAELGGCIKTGKSPYVEQFGSKFWDELAKHPIRGKQFNELMREKSEPGIVPIAKAYPFHEYKVIVDVGGGIGHLLEGILNVAAPQSTGILFEIPAVIGDALKKMQPGSVLATRCTLQEGDMFTSVVGGGDLYMMKRILHDWDDESCLKILKNVRQQMKPTSKLLIMDSIVSPENKGFDASKFFDITMMTLLNGKERTEGEFGILAQQAGLKISRVIAVPHAHLSLIECELST